MGDMLPAVLRVHAEPYAYHDDASVHRRIARDPHGYVRFLRQRLTDIASGGDTVTLPPKSLFVDGPGQGDFRVMPCVIGHGTNAVKVVKVIGTNLDGREVPDQVTVGKVLCLHPTENFVRHIFEACLLSSARTGACAALAIGLLGTHCEDVAIVGAGRVGYYTGLFVGGLDGVRRVVFSDAVAGRAAEVAATLADRASGCCYTAASADTVATADVVIVATTSTEALFCPGDLQAALVVSMGADTEEQRELSQGWVDAADLYVDTRDSFAVGDLRAWSNGLGRAPTVLADLVGLFAPNGSGERSARRRVFIGTGSALLDALTVEYLLRPLGNAGPAAHA